MKLQDFVNGIKSISDYAWVHFEGRPNIEEIKKMLEFIHKTWEAHFLRRPKISLEMEKLNRNYDPLLPLVDVIFVSKEYALSKGFENKSELVKGFHPDLKCLVICAWGDQGASGRDLNGQIIEIPASKPPSGKNRTNRTVISNHKHIFTHSYSLVLGVIDTIGAGDTFNATVVACLSQGKNLTESLDTGCKVAGAKVGQVGYNGLKAIFYS